MFARYTHAMMGYHAPHEPHMHLMVYTHAYPVGLGMHPMVCVCISWSLHALCMHSSHAPTPYIQLLPLSLPPQSTSFASHPTCTSTEVLCLKAKEPFASSKTNKGPRLFALLHWKPGWYHLQLQNPKWCQLTPCTHSPHAPKPA
uniref:Uncharacterized protein n=1 Tax=Phasianus colchicus TaxID=9054 RepID=A0A669QSM8_PHACC